MSFKPTKHNIIPAFKKEYKPKLFFLLAKSTDHSLALDNPPI